VPVLSLTIATSASSAKKSISGFMNGEQGGQDPFGEEVFREESLDPSGHDRETIVTQDIPIRVLSAASVESIHEPRVREPDAHVLLPSLIQLKAVSDRFTKLAAATISGGNASGLANAANTPKLELSANMHGSLKLSIATDALSISSLWTDLSNPELDPNQAEDGIEGVENHPSTVLKAAGPDAWATVRIDGRDWGRVLSVGRMGGRVIACAYHHLVCSYVTNQGSGFVDEHALILYVYLSNYEDGADESVLTVSGDFHVSCGHSDSSVSVLYQLICSMNGINGVWSWWQAF
jgi:HUS1 checkpoint protein